MSTNRWKLAALAATVIVTACAKDAVSPGSETPVGVSFAVLPVINVSTIDSLYSVINNPANVGRDVRLAPGTYKLDTTRVFFGRLQLQQDMTLRGVGGRQDEVIIDASALQAKHFMDGTLLTGAIRVGRGTNTIESLTIKNASAGAAGIETDLADGSPTHVRIAHVIATGNVRGIDIRNTGAAMAHRALTVELSENELRDNRVGMGFGVRFLNSTGATGATIDAVIDNNKIHDNTVGCLVANQSTDSASITIDSHADRVERNGSGCVFLTGLMAAKHNSISFRAGSSRFVGNGFPLAPRGDSVAILAVGGVRNADNVEASYNTLTIDLWGVLFKDNRLPDLAAFGSQAPAGQLGQAGVENSVLIMLHGMSKDATYAPPQSVGTNTATITKS